MEPFRRGTIKAKLAEDGKSIVETWKEDRYRGDDRQLELRMAGISRFCLQFLSRVSRAEIQLVSRPEVTIIPTLGCAPLTVSRPTRQVDHCDQKLHDSSDILRPKAAMPRFTSPAAAA